MYEKFDTLIIEPDMASRMRLKQATTSVPTFGKLYQASSLTEGQDQLSREKLDVIFISETIPKTEILNFIKKSKESAQGQDSAYVLILKRKDQDASTVAMNMAVGSDGFLVEPFSVDSLVEITRLATRVKGERAEVREKAAMKFLMTEIGDQISVIAQLKSLNMDTGRQARKLREMCAIFDTLDEETRAKYLSIAVDTFENLPVPKPLEKIKAYGGVSDRIKKRLEQKIVNKLKTGTTEPAA